MNQFEQQVHKQIYLGSWLSHNLIEHQVKEVATVVSLLKCSEKTNTKLTK